MLSTGVRLLGLDLVSHGRKQHLVIGFYLAHIWKKEVFGYGNRSPSWKEEVSGYGVSSSHTSKEEVSIQSWDLIQSWEK
jgi:hypothetical protein